jgi:hypothetical protein
METKRPRPESLAIAEASLRTLRFIGCCYECTGELDMGVVHERCREAYLAERVRLMERNEYLREWVKLRR